MHSEVNGGTSKSIEGVSTKIRRSANSTNVAKLQTRGRPSMEIYRPPASNNDVTAQMSNRSGYPSVPVASQNGLVSISAKAMQFSSPKSANSLKRSKSFAAQTHLQAVNSHQMQHNTLTGETTVPAEDENGHSACALTDPLVKRALLDPNLLSILQIMEVVRTICTQAIEGVNHASPCANLCLSIIEKEDSDTFLESLLNSCREWYNAREKLLRLIKDGSEQPSRWLAYVTFVAELYHRLRPNRLITPRAITLCTLLYDCIELLLRPGSLKNTTELDCLRAVLTIIGKQIECDAPQRMNNLVNTLRDSFLGSMSANNQSLRKNVLEIIELRASSWKFDLQQSMYYFPYTK